MTEKEKAKAYDEAIERAKKLYGNEITKEIFSELKENNNERIKKNCIHFLELQKQHHAATFEIEECIDWIKKQCKNSTDKTKPRFKVGDWVVDNCGYIWKIERILNQFYLLEDTKGGESRPTIDWVNDTFHLWTVQDAKYGDVICYRDEIILFKSYFVLQGRISLYCWYNRNTNNFYSKEIIYTLSTTRYKVYPATKEQRDILMKAMNDAGYEWDSKKKELKKKKK